MHNIKQYMRDYYLKNKEKILAQNREWKKANKEARLEKNRGYEKEKYHSDIATSRSRGREKYHKYKDSWRAVSVAGNAKRRARKLNATPPWLSKKHITEIQEFYKIAKELRWLSEENLHVDHIVPLNGKDVCGLHVPWNLQILPARQNIAKGNRKRGY